MNDLKNLEIEVLEILDFDLHLKDFEVEALPSYLKFWFPSKFCFFP